MPRDSKDTSSSDVTLAFLIGAIAGATLALLFAPQTGVETRRFLGEKAREGQGKAKEALERGREAFQKAMEGDSV